MNEGVREFRTILFQNVISVELLVMIMLIVKMKHVTFYLFNANHVRKTSIIAALINVLKLLKCLWRNKKFLERALIIGIKFLKKEDQNLLSLRIEKIC